MAITGRWSEISTASTLLFEVSTETPLFYLNQLPNFTQYIGLYSSCSITPKADNSEQAKNSVEQTQGNKSRPLKLEHNGLEKNNVGQTERNSTIGINDILPRSGEYVQTLVAEGSKAYFTWNVKRSGNQLTLEQQVADSQALYVYELDVMKDRLVQAGIRGLLKKDRKISSSSRAYMVYCAAWIIQKQL